MKSSFYSLVPFLPLLCNCQFRRLDSIQFLCYQAHVLAGWRPESRHPASDYYCSVLPNTSLHPLCTYHAENTACIVGDACFRRRCLAKYILLSRALALAKMCLPSRCVAIDIQVTIRLRGYYAIFHT
jgi:hypothetical protein